MNENNNFNIGVNVVPDEPVVYDSYYNHQPRKTPWIVMMGLLAITIIVLIILWVEGVFTPIDRQAEYNKLLKRVCNNAIKYADNKYSSAKKVSGKIVYVTVEQLIESSLVEANLTNYLTNEPISSTTNIRLEALPSGSFTCHGFLFSGDDTEKPVITLKGSSTITSSVGATLTDPGATATDNYDGDISDQISRSGNVNKNQAGTYTVYYVVSDKSGNSSDTITRTFIIK